MSYWATWKTFFALNESQHFSPIRVPWMKKMRIALPAKWRPEIEEDAFLAPPNPIGCITVYAPKMITRSEEKVAEVSFGGTQGQMVLAEIIS